MHAPANSPWTECRIVFWAQAICLASLLLNVLSILHPALLGDDWEILRESWTWDRTRANLWVPHNEHSMPLGRLAIWLMGLLAGNQGNVSLVFALQGPLALLAAMVMVFLLVRRETGQPFPALLGMALFGVNTHYQNAVIWFSASYTLVALNMLLLGLLAAQRWRQTGKWRWLALSAFWCALAPGWFGSGVLAGPLCTLYLLVPRSPDLQVATGPGKALPLSARLMGLVRRVVLPALVPALGTAISLAITLPLNGKKIRDLPRVELPATAWQTFDPLVGLEYTLRAMVDDLIPGALGFHELTSPIAVVIGIWIVFLIVGVLWWRQAPHRALLALGLGLIVMSYEAIYTVRAYFPYEGMHHWGRYHLWAHLGLVLFLCGGLPRGIINWVNGASKRAIDLGAACLLGLILLTQVPRIESLYYGAQQLVDLERLAAVDARSRKHHIDAATASQALAPFRITGMGDDNEGRPLSAWDLLRGSSDPHSMSPEDARQLLESD